jgi:phospholipase C
MIPRTLPAVLALAACALLSGCATLGARATLEGVPRYDHVFVILEENKDYGQIMDGAAAPNLAGLAKTYGNAARFYGETHPSEGNYVALLGGDNFGIHDDDAFYCKPGMKDRYCPFAAMPGYVDHTIKTPHLGDQLQRAGLSWKAYLESLPKPGSLAYVAEDRTVVTSAAPLPVYASKHAGFVNFASAQTDPRRARHLVGFDVLRADLAANRLPNFALVVPNQCNEMHGLPAVAGVPADCVITNTAPLIKRGDAEVGSLVAAIQATRAWRSKANVAIVITFDEGGLGGREGCCGKPENGGGGHIPTIVVTNHGPRGLADQTPYDHYSLLRTLEDAFGITDRLGHSGDDAAGVKPMTPLFAVK